MEAGEAEKHDGYFTAPIRAVSPGEADLFILNEAGEQIGYRYLKADAFLSVYDYGTGNYTGDTGVLISVTLFWLLMSAMMIWHFLQARGSAFYDYSSIYYAGFSLFALGTGLTLLTVTAEHLRRPDRFFMLNAYSVIGCASRNFMSLTAPAMVLFALAMIISNLVLLKHQPGKSCQNLIGLLIGMLLIAGEGIGWWLFSQDFMGSEWEYRVRNMLENTYATVFIYFQCMLTGSVISGILSARRRPAADKDFIIIHGCWFRKDGTLPPLLRGRADAAVAFWKREKQETGKEAYFIPSGGQGGDEPMAEAEAIRQYLLSQGMEDRLILPETASLTTRENMRFSRGIIERVKPDGKTAFATSSYHVFRSGLWARQEGLEAEGIGSRTKWWYWPNSFMRETVGLLQKRWKQELLFLVALMVFFGMLTLVL